MTNIAKNGNEMRMLFKTTLNENGYTDNFGKTFKKSMFKPVGITVAIPVKSFTSPPPHIFNCHKRNVTVNVITIEIIEAKMNLMLAEISVKNRFDKRPKAIRL